MKKIKKFFGRIEEGLYELGYRFTRFWVRIFARIVIGLHFIHNERQKGILYSVAQFNKEEVLIVCQKN